MIEPVDDHTCTFTTGADDLTTLAIHLGLLDVDFRVDGPPDLVDKLHQLAARYAAPFISNDSRWRASASSGAAARQR